MDYFRVKDEFLSAFTDINHDEAHSLLHLLIEQIEIVSLRLSVEKVLSQYIIRIDRFEASLLHVSSRNGWLDITKELIEKYELDPKKIDNKGNTCFHYAAPGNHLNVMKYLTSRNLRIRSVPMSHVSNHNRDTPLHIAASHKALDVMKYLIEYQHCDPKLTNNTGRTVLHFGAKHIDTVHYLITECNCDPLATDRKGRTVLHYAVQKHCQGVVEYLVLSSGKCDPLLAANKYGNTVLHFASANGLLKILKYLIYEHKCDPMIADKDGKTVLHSGARHINIVKYLISECNCDPMATDKDGKTVLHSGAKYVNIVKYLITECNCDPMATDKDGKTVLHYAMEHNHLDVVEFLLSTGKCALMAKENTGKIPLQLVDDNNRENVRKLVSKFGQVQTSHPVDFFVNVLLLGNEAGKIILSKAIIDTDNSLCYFGSFSNIRGAESHTAGTVPHKLRHKTLGNIILHNFAGHPKYRSSHSAVIENLLHGSGRVFLIVVNILEKEALKNLHRWLAVEQKCHIIVVVINVDEIIDTVEMRKRKEEIQEIIERERCDGVFLNCHKHGGSSLDSFFNKLSSACESIRSTSGRNLSFYCHMMYGLLQEKENILTLSDVMTATENNDTYVLPDEEKEVLAVLCSLDSIGLIKVLKSEDKVWVVVNKGILLSEVDGILKTVREQVDIASNTGIVSVSGLTRRFPDYDPDMLICFLKNMELCQEMSSLPITSVIPIERKGEKFMFFPCLLYSDRPDEITSQVYQFGWCLQCTREDQFFPPRYFHILFLHLAYNFALPQVKEKLDRRCTFWWNGIHWFNGEGVGVLVEIVDKSQYVLVLMSYQKDCSENMVHIRRKVIREVVRLYKKSCPSLEVEELVIDHEELLYPVRTLRERTLYSVKDVMSCIVEQRGYLVNATGTRQTKLESILTGESLSDISNLSLLGGRDIKEAFDITAVCKPVTSENKLDIRDLDIIIKELTSTQYLPCSVWHDLGLQLGLYDPRLVDVNEKNRGDPVKCFRECMSAWLKGEDKVREVKGGPCWLSLVSALDTIGEKQIATNISEKYKVIHFII